MYEGKNIVHIMVKVNSLCSQQLPETVELDRSDADIGREAITPDPAVVDLEEFEWTDDDEEFDAWKNIPCQDSLGLSTNKDNDAISGYESADSSDAMSGYKSGNDEHVPTDSDNSDVEEPLFKLGRQMIGDEFKLDQKGKVEFHVEQVFDNVDHFRKVLKDYVVQEGFDVDKKKNERNRVTWKCREDNCPWRIHASPMADGITFKVRTYNSVHTCLRNSKNNKEATSVWIADKMEKDLRRNPEMSVEDMAGDLRDTYGIECASTRLYRARRKARERFEGDYASSYNKLPAYGAVLRQYNPGTLVKLSFYEREYDERTNLISNPVFKRFFVAFPALRNGFLSSCRPFIDVDGCFLKGPFKGMLLSAVTLDANSGIIPLAIMVAEGETKDSWEYFLDLLDTWIGQGQNKTLTFMSDRKKGILDAVKKQFPTAHHRFCARHLFSNFMGKFPGVQLRGLFWGAVRATNEVEFNYYMAEIRAKKKEAYDWLMEVPPVHWSAHLFDESVKSDHTSNNMTESFNSWLGKYRGKPILTLLENFWRKVMRRIHRRHEKASTWTSTVTPYVRKKLEQEKKESRHCELFTSTGLSFEVKEKMVSYIVNLQEGTCNCRAWAISGIPCKHVLAAISYQRDNPKKYCHAYLNEEAYLMTYSENIKPVPDEKMWPTIEHNPILPHVIKRRPGRPKKNRTKEPHESIATSTNKGKRYNPLRCKACSEIGHNKRTCPTVKSSKSGVPASSSQASGRSGT